ncbi:hypothetical protein F5Y14DRAFT_450838 [Nemania sp. NC0429]|nr:hypothetical protein F5Y14DRAFT_450838 [Nemania sp. NC0429]
MAVPPPTQPGMSSGAAEDGLAGAGEGPTPPSRDFKGTFLRYLSAGPVELRGVRPVPLEERTSTQYSTYEWLCRVMSGRSSRR